MGKISAVLCVVEEELSLLPRALASIKSLAEDIVVIDMSETGIPKELKKEFGLRVYQKPRAHYVEQVRNYGLSKVTGDWIIIIDPDEVISLSLSKSLRKIVEKPEADYFRLPRKNITFGKWIMHSRWWPDYNIRFFRRGFVSWNEIIHAVPITKGVGKDLPDKESYAILHENYISLEQYLQRMGRYTNAQANELVKSNYKFIWKDLVKKPTGEFLSRYFLGEGYKDGVHGLALAGLQAFSEFVLYLKVWEKEKFLEQGITIAEISNEGKNLTRETNWWLSDLAIKSKSMLSSLPDRLFRKLTSK